MFGSNLLAFFAEMINLLTVGIFGGLEGDLVVFKKLTMRNFVLLESSFGPVSGLLR